MLYLAVNDQIRSKGYGTKILGWLKLQTAKIIVFHDVRFAEKMTTKTVSMLKEE